MSEQPQQFRQKIARWLPLIIAAAPALIAYWLIHRDGVDMPYWDEWDHGFVDLAIKAYHGTLSWTDFTAPHNEHRVIVPKLIYLVLTWATHWNEFALMYFGWAVACATSVCIGILCFKTASRGRATVSWFICNLLIFTPTQWENWLAGYGMINFLPVACISAALVAGMSKWRDSTKLSIMILLATAATFSSLQGFLAWPLIGAFLALTDSPADAPKRKRRLILWTTAFALNLMFYLIGYHADASSRIREEPMSFVGKVKFGLAYLGNPFFNNSLSALGISIAIGVIMLLVYFGAFACFVHLWRGGHKRERCRALLIWLLIGGFTLATGVLAVIFRSSVGMSMALAGRYATSTIYLPIALVNLIPMMLDDLPKRSPAPRNGLWRWSAILWAPALLVFYIISARWGWSDAAVAARVRRQGKAGLLLINVLPDSPLLPETLYSKPHDVIPLARELNDMGYLRPGLIVSSNPFEMRDRSFDKDSQIDFGHVVGLQEEALGRLILSGWAALPHLDRPADAIIMSYDDKNGQPIIFTMGVMGGATPDLVRRTGDSHYELCGWEVHFPAELLPEDMKSFRMRAWAIDINKGTAYPLKGNPTIVR